MKLKILAVVVIVLKFLLGSSVGFGATHPNLAESKASFYELKEALERRFDLMSGGSIASSDCKIKIMDSSLTDTIRIQVTSIDKRSAQFYLSLGQSLKFKSSAKHFEALSYTETCETQGCDDNWYVDQHLVVDTDSLVLSLVAPYTARKTRISCHLLQ